MGVSAEGLRWYPSTLEQTVIETTLINLCTWSTAPSIAHNTLQYTTKPGQEYFKKCVTPTLVTSFGEKKGCYGNEVFFAFFLFFKSVTAHFRLSEEAGTGTSETHHFAEWSFVLLRCIIKTSL